MQTKLIRVEQTEANTPEVDHAVNAELQKLENAGHTIKDIRLAVGRDADSGSGLEKRFSVTVMILYE